MDELNDIIAKLRKYAYARNRTTDREVRTFTITDDEALTLLIYMDGLDAALDRSHVSEALPPVDFGFEGLEQQ